MAPSDEFMEAQFGTEYNTTAQLSASQLIFDGSYFVGLKAAKAYVELSKLGLDKKTLETKESIASVYYNALVMKERGKLLEENISSTQLQINEFSALVDAGFREQLDLDQMELRLTNLETAKQQIERSTELIYQLLKMFMGMPVEEELTLTDDLNEAMDAINYNDLESVKYGSANDIDFKQISVNGDLMKLNWKKEKMTLLPQVSAFFSYQQVSMGNELTFDTWYPTTLWGVSARIPIFGGGSKYYRIQENKLAYEKAQLQMQDLDRMLTQNAIDVRSNFMTAYEAYTNTKKALDISQKIKDRTYTKYQEGVSSSFEYNQAQNQYLQAQETYISSVTQLLDAKTKFDKAYNNY
jgi:outer membrane protein TolC